MLTRLANIAPTFIHRLFWSLLCFLLSKKNPRLRQKLEEIEGKIFLFDILGVTYSYAFTIKEGTLKPCAVHNGIEPDVILRATSSLFLNLITSRVDFDQAFFSRRLKIERDLETALYLKNVLD